MKPKPIKQYEFSLPYATASDTSKAAAESMKGKPSEDQRYAVFHAILNCGDRGATCDELEASLNLPHQSCSARVHELAQHGYIEKTEYRRETRSGRNAAVYRVKKR